MIHNSEADALTTAIITTMVQTACAPVALDPPGDNPMGDSEGDPEPPDRPRAMSLYELIVAECQAELNARFGLAEPVVMVMNTDFAPVGWPV